MGDLFWPGLARAEGVFDDTAFLAALVRTEQAWLTVLDRPARPDGPHSAASDDRGDLAGLVGPADLPALGVAAERDGTPVSGLVALLRERSGQPWVHRGLTSQDVVDTALMLMLRDCVDRVEGVVAEQVRALAALAEEHRDQPMVARTLTQHAVPTTFGLRAATWLHGVLDAADDLAALRFPVQLGGAAGTLAALVELGLDPTQARTRLAGELGLEPAPPWHTRRRPVTRAGDALVACLDAWGRIANDVLVQSRSEIGELREATGGGSSTMAHKHNPVRATLVHRAALTAPPLGASLHAAAADQVDERAPGAWHAEWDPLRVLARRCLVAAEQTRDLLEGLQVDTARLDAHVAAAAADLLAEQATMARLAGHAPAGDYTGAAGALVDESQSRARAWLDDRRSQ